MTKLLKKCNRISAAVHAVLEAEGFKNGKSEENY
jgi:hypothetical protein